MFFLVKMSISLAKTTMMVFPISKSLTIYGLPQTAAGSTGGYRSPNPAVSSAARQSCGGGFPPQGDDLATQLRSDQLTLVICCIWGIILLSYIKGLE